MDFKDRVAIVTGASSGIGEALVRQLAREGARVVLAARSEEQLQAVAASLDAERVLVVPTDVTEPADIDHLIERTATRFGGIDILVNNAGFGLYGGTEEILWEHLRQMWEVNFFGAVRCTRAALPYLCARRGVVVNISSVAGKIVVPYMTQYCATKHALNAFSDGLRMELRQAGVRVVTVCPGRVRTRFHQAAYRDSKNLPAVLRRQDVGGISADAVALATLRAVRRGRREIVIPWRLRLAAGLRKLFPALVEASLARWVRPSQPTGD
ncbi:MAG: SDR family oxidoreductase [Candidatus Acidiferrales bacterium]